MASAASPAVLQVSSAPSRAAYDSVDQIVRLTDDRPAGLIVHAAAEQPDGTVLILDVWESGEAMDAFERDRLLPAFGSAAADPRGPMPTRPTRHPAFTLVKG